MAIVFSALEVKRSLRSLTSGLTLRERLLLLAATLVALCGAFYAFVYLPGVTASQNLRQEIEQLAKLTDRLKAVDAAVLMTAVEVDERSLPILVTQTADSLGLAISRLSEEGTAVEVQLASVDFPAFVSWLDVLINQYKIVVADLEVTRLVEPAMVAVRLRLADGSVDR